MKKNLLILALVLLIVFVFLSPIWTERVGIFMDDVAVNSYPYAVFQARSLQQGVFPLWEPHTFAGAFPFYTRIDTCSFYPPQIVAGLIASLKSPEAAYRTLIIRPIIFHYLIAAVGAFLLGRAWLRLNRVGSGAMALTYALSSSLINGMLNPPLLYGQAWFPWLVLMVALYARTGRPLCLVGGALIFATFISVFPIFTLQGVFIAAVFAGVIILRKLAERKFASAGSLAVGWGGMLAAGLLLSSIFWLSFRESVEYVRATYPTTLDFLTAGPRSVPFGYWASVFVPELFNSINFAEFWGIARGGEIFYCEAYLTRGFWLLLPAVLAVWAFLLKGGSDPRLKTFTLTAGGLFLFSVLLMLGRYTPVFPALYKICPFFRLAYASRWHTLYSFSLALLVGVGSANLCDKRTAAAFLARKRLLVYAGAVTGLVGAALIVSLAGGAERPELDWFLFNPVLYWLVSVLVIVLLSIFFRPRLAGGLIVVLALADLLYFSGRAAYLPPGVTWETEQERVRGPAESEFHLASRRALSAGRDPFYRTGFWRSYLDGGALETGGYCLLGVSTKPLFPRMHALLDRICEGFPYQLTVRDFGTRFPANFSVRDWWLDRPVSPRSDWVARGPLGAGGLYHFVDPEALPRFYTLDTWRYGSEAEEREAVLTGDLRRGVVCGDEASGVPARPGPTDRDYFEAFQRDNPIGEVRLDNPNELSLRVSLEKPSWLVVADAWHPGWKATDNGKAVAVRQVNYLQRGIWLEAGEHEVRMKFEPAAWRWGLRLTAAGVLVCLLLIPLGRFLKDRER